MPVKPPKVSSKRMTADELRDTFIRFFEKRGHQHVNSASVVPRDKTLLFTSAGMVQFKPYFSGEIDPDEHGIAKRATTHQKCVRTTDLDLVGDATHLTFFEMLGNFSFNDYFKEDACKWALELMVDELGFDRDRLLFTIHPSDDEAHAVWRGLGVPDERIHRFQDNWWGPVGGEGACGPCSEIHVYMGDMKKLREDNYRMDPDSGEFIELYNLVFPQFYRERNGEDRDLERRNVDTGMGLERVLAVMSQADSPYETELFKPMLELIADAADKSIDDPQHRKPLRVITEHLRAAFFMLADGVIPDNAGQGAVLRNIIRRAFDATSEIWLKEIPSEEYLKLLADKMGATYPELKKHQSQSLQTLKSEEENYGSNLGDPTRKMWLTIGFFWEANSKLSKGDYRGAISDYDKAIELDPSNASAYSNRGMVKSKLGRYEEAIDDYDKAIELDPNNASAYNNRGNVKDGLGRYEEAINDYDKAIELDPDNVVTYNNRGHTKAKLGNYEAATSDYDKMIELVPTHAEAYSNRGVIKSELGNYEAAISDYDKAIELAPDRAEAYYNRGIAKTGLGNYEAAISDYDKAIELAPDHVRAYTNRGNVKARLGNYETAISDYDKAIELVPDHVGAYYNRGITKSWMSNDEAAISDYDKTIELAPDHAGAYCSRGMAKGNLGNYKAAIGDFDKAIELDPSNAGVYEIRRRVKAKLGKYEEITEDLPFRTADTRGKSDYGDFPNQLEQGKNKGFSEQQNEPVRQQSGDGIQEDLSKILGKLAFRHHDRDGVSLEAFIKDLEEDEPLSQKDKDEIKRHYEIELEKKREHDSGRSKFKKGVGRQVFDDLPLAATEFVRGEYMLKSEIKAIVKDGESVEQIDEGAAAMLVFERTPFYAEKGGQVGDTGYVKAEEGGTVLAEVADTQEGGRGIYTHRVENVRKTLKVGMKVQLEIDHERRERIMRNHTGTHLVHAALREVLGHSTRQFGSLVHPDYLRFDFTAPGPVSRENLDKVQAIVNERIRKNQPVTVHHTTYGKAVKEGALAFFEGKYGEKVRTIKIDVPWSYELCGGTHMESTGGIGAFIITGESGVSNGVRRIFALTGVEAEKAIGHVQELTRRLNMPRFDVGELERKLNTLQKERDDTAERYKRLENRYLKLLSKADGEDVGEEVNYKLEYKGNGSSPLPVQVRVVSQMKLEALRKLGDSMRDKLGSGVVILGSDFEGEATLVVMATKGSAAEQVHAGKLVQRLTASMGGSGGGSPLVGQGGGRDASKLANALSKKGVTKALKELNA